LPQLILSASGKWELTFLTSLLLTQTDTTGSREKKLQANSLPPRGRASPWLFSWQKRHSGSWHPDLHAQLEEQLLSCLPLSLQSYCVKFTLFSYASLLVFADIYELSIVCIHKSCVSFNFNSSTFIALMTLICGSILEDSSVLHSSSSGAFAGCVNKAFGFAVSYV